MVKIILKKNKYYLFLNNQVMFSQEIVKSAHIPKTLSPKFYWFMYMVFIANKFGLINAQK